MKTTVIILTLGMLFLFMDMGEAAECGSIPTGGCTINQSTTFLPGTYLLQQGITIIGNNLELDCNGAVLQNAATGFLMMIQSLDGSLQTGITIKNCALTHLGAGIFAGNVTNSIFRNNVLDSSIPPSAGIVLGGTDAKSANNTIVNNYLNRSNIQLVNCEEDTIMNNVLDSIGSNSAIHLFSCQDVLVEGNTVSAGGKAMETANCGPCINLTIRNNVLQGNGDGIYLDSGVTQSMVYGNSIDANSNGIYLGHAFNNTVFDNFVSNSGQVGIFVSGAAYENIIYRNNLVNNVDQGRDEANSNQWNSTNEGNYWSDFDTPAEGCTDNDLNNICDTPYVIDSMTAKDYFPSVGQFNIAPPPMFLFPLLNQAVNEMDTLTIIVNATSLLPLTYSIQKLPSLQPDQNFIVINNTLIWQTNFTDAGIYSRVVVVTDTNHMKASQNISITVNNAANTACTSIPKNSCTVSQNTSFLPGTYSLKDGLSITAPNVALNCNGATITAAFFAGLPLGAGITAKVSAPTIQNCRVSSYRDGIVLVNTKNTTLRNSEAERNSNNGMQLTNADSIRVLNSTSNDNGNDGLMVLGTDFGRFENITSNRNTVGVWLENANDNQMVTSIITRNFGEGIMFSPAPAASSRNTINASRFDTNGLSAITVGAGQQNVITENLFINHTISQNPAVYLAVSSVGARVFRNNFLNNIADAQDTGTKNQWNDSSVGNYHNAFDSLGEGCFDANFDGLCDAPMIFQFNQEFFSCTNQDCWINKWPIITSTCSTTGQVGIVYTCDVNAVDPEGQSITYSLIKSPPGMTINSVTREITWLPGRMSKNSFNSVIVRATDSLSGYREQKFKIDLNGNEPNSEGDLQPETK